MVTIEYVTPIIFEKTLELIEDNKKDIINGEIEYKLNCSYCGGTGSGVLMKNCFRCQGVKSIIINWVTYSKGINNYCMKYLKLENK